MKIAFKMQALNGVLYFSVVHSLMVKLGKPIPGTRVVEPQDIQTA